MDDNQKCPPMHRKTVIEQSKFASDCFIKYVNEVNNQGIIEVTSPKVNQYKLFECFKRVHQRDYYYRYFHSMPNGISEMKQFALIVYWILKYMPFEYHLSNITLNSENKSDEERHLKYAANQKLFFIETYCIWLFKMMFEGIHKERLILSKYSINKLKYSLHNHDVSKEALILIFEIIEYENAKSNKMLISHHCFDNGLLITDD